MPGKSMLPPDGGDDQQQQDQQQQDQQQDDQQQDDQQQDSAKPDWLPDNLWDDEAGTFNQSAFDALGQATEPEDLPSSADDYTMPAIEGVEADALAKDPVVAFLRGKAFERKLGQADFADLVEGYWTSETARLDALHAEEIGKLGENSSTRISNVNKWLRANLSGEELEAVRSATTSAAAIRGLERLMNKGGKTRSDPPPAKTAKSKAEIETMMSDPRYYDPQKRDAAWVKEIDDWFEANSGD